MAVCQQGQFQWMEVITNTSVGVNKINLIQAVIMDQSVCLLLAQVGPSMLLEDSKGQMDFHVHLLVIITLLEHVITVLTMVFVVLILMLIFVVQMAQLIVLVMMVILSGLLLVHIVIFHRRLPNYFLIVDKYNKINFNASYSAGDC
tara:strand:+ start:292 stop:729 length:438 start_codon:yes stop_codon:yes gene_type:complete